jgi:hypothetical protein
MLFKLFQRSCSRSIKEIVNFWQFELMIPFWTEYIVDHADQVGGPASAMHALRLEHALRQLVRACV